MSEGQSLVSQWNEVMLDAIRTDGASPTQTTYHMHLISSAVYDAWAAYDEKAYGHYSEIEADDKTPSEANKAEAISYAFHEMLTGFFPDQSDKFDTFMADLGYDPEAASPGTGSAAAVGLLAAENVRAARQNDGSNVENNFADTSGYVPVNGAEEGSPTGPGGDDFDPNHWQPLRVPNGTLLDANGNPTYDDNDPSTYNDQVALTPHWGDVAAFALPSGDAVRPDAPPQLGDFSEYIDGLGNVTTGNQAYIDQFTETMIASATLTTEQKVIAEYWADGPRTESPPGHWNQIAQDISLREGHGIDEDAKMFFALNAALFDAGIATWEAKYHYDFVRPQSAIRDLYYDQTIEAWGGPDQGTTTILAQEWQPYQDTTFVTPPFPEFTSGHSGFSMAAANTIAAFVGSDAFYDGTTLSNYDLDSVEGKDLIGQYVTTELAFETFTGEPVVLQWETLTEAAEEAGISRIYGGIHIQDGDLRGREIGADVADLAETQWTALFTMGGDDKVRGTKEADELLLGAGDDHAHTRKGDDIVKAGSGDDYVNLSAGNDTGYGEAGNDKILGGKGEDSLFGGDGEDMLSGGADDDLLEGGAGDDNLRGNSGNDRLFGDAGEDNLRGGSGNDRLEGGADGDKLLGNQGNDVLLGQDGEDTLIGGAGRDVLMGGNDNDILRGGADADVFVFNLADTGTDTLLDFEIGVDLLQVIGATDANQLAFTQVGRNAVLSYDGQDLAELRRTDVDDLSIWTDVIPL
ncbi:MAG: DUF6851 domain-containing protein [Pseudomonadota bacterium]